MHYIVYDCEIRKAIQGRSSLRLPGIEYCNGWEDHAGMGVSVICAYDSATGRYRAFCEDNFLAFKQLVTQADLIVSFNGLKFDNRLCRTALGIDVPDFKSYDLLAEMWRADGLDPLTFGFKTHGGYGLDATARANGLPGKSGNGAMAPVDWQEGRIGHVIDYCLDDVHLLDVLFQRACYGELCHPNGSGDTIAVRLPEQVLANPIIRDLEVDREARRG